MTRLSNAPFPSSPFGLLEMALQGFEMPVAAPLSSTNDAYPQLPPLGSHQLAQMQMALVFQGQFLEMLATWLILEQLTSGGPGSSRNQGRLSEPDARGWGQWRTADKDWRGCPSSPRTTPEPRTPTTSIERPSLNPGEYDGRAPAPECTSTRASACVDPPLTSSAARGRDASTYAQVINQFAVGDNPRYARRNGNTYCNIFAWDVTRAMGAELPHWRRHDGTPAQPFERGAYEMNANGTARWLEQHGERYGWRRVSPDEAQAHANRGAPAVAIRDNPGGIGHVAVVRPGEMSDRGPCIAQAGGRNFNEGHARDVWRRSDPAYWVHD